MRWMFKSRIICLVVAIFICDEVSAQESLKLEEFRPQSELKTAHTKLVQSKFPAIDVHTHFRVKLRSSEHLDEFLGVMNRNATAICISADGRLGDELREHIAMLESRAPGRFAVLANLDWNRVDQHDFVRDSCERLKEAKTIGAIGVKVFKEFGLTLKWSDGTLVRIDDERFDPIWRTCGELGFPVLIHTADPTAFFKPIDARNERWEELHRRPEWSFFGPGFPKHEELIAAFDRLVKRHERTIFIGAHVAGHAEDLAAVSERLDRLPNLRIDIASRIAELGRQPYTARKFLMKHQDRVLFGTDGPWPEERLRLYWRFLETYDENIPYSEKEFPPQGFWNIHGVSLPEETLRKIYFENALALWPQLKEKYERYETATKSLK